jgi:hypothetical protein
MTWSDLSLDEALARRAAGSTTRRTAIRPESSPDLTVRIVGMFGPNHAGLPLEPQLYTPPGSPETVERWSDRIPWVIEDQRVEASGRSPVTGVPAASATQTMANPACGPTAGFHFVSALILRLAMVSLASSRMDVDSLQRERTLGRCG